MFKWITVLQLLFLVHLHMGEVTSKRTINVGTVLFNNSDSEKDCWTSESVLLLMSRSLMQMMLPEDYVSEYEKSNVDSLISYLYNTLNTVRSLSKGSAQQVMVLALSDVIGGYMRSQLLPSIKREYYQGNIAFGEVEQLYSLYAHLKSLLRTNGDGWRIPRKVDIKLNDIPSLRIPVKKTSEDVCEHFDVGHPSKNSYVLTIPVPHLDSDIDPQSIAMPFRRESVSSIQEASSADIVQKYYSDGMQCLLAASNEEGVMEFSVEMDAWLKKSVMPLLELEELYPAFGGVYRVLATVQRVRALKRGASLNERAPLAVARDRDSNIPFLSALSPQTTDSAVAVMKRLPIQQRPAFVASVRQEKVPNKPTNDLKYSDNKYSEHLEETSIRAPVELSSGFKNGETVTKSYTVHKNEHSSEPVSNKQLNFLFDSLSSETANGEAPLDTAKVQISSAKSEPVFVSIRPNTASPQPLQSRSTFVPFYFHENVTHESKDTGIFYPINALSNYLTDGETNVFKTTQSLRSVSSTWSIEPPDSHDRATTLSDISVNVHKNVHESVEPYIGNYSVSLPLSRSPSVMSSTIPVTSPESHFFTNSKDTYFNIFPISSNDLKGYKNNYNNDKHPIHSQPHSMSSLPNTSNLIEKGSLFESPLISENISSTFETKESTFVSEPSALSLFFGVPTTFLPYSPLPTSLYSGNVPSESCELSSVGSFPTSPTSLLVETFHPVFETVSTSSPTPSKLTDIVSSTAIASQEVAHEKSNNSEIAVDIKNQSQVSVQISSPNLSVSRPSYDDKHSKIMRTSHLKGHNIHSKIHEKSPFRFLKPFHMAYSPFAKLGFASPLYNHKGAGGSGKNVTSFIRSNVKSTTVDHSLMVGIPNILLESPHFPNSQHSQYTFVNAMTPKNDLITNNAHLGYGITSHGNSMVNYSNNSYNDRAMEGYALTLLSTSESITPNSIDTSIIAALITKRHVPGNGNSETSPEMFEEMNKSSGLLAWKRCASKDPDTFPYNSYSDQTITLETYVVPYGSVVSAFESGNKFLLSSILPPAANVKNYDERKPDFLSMDLNYIDENSEFVSANSNLNIPGISSDKSQTENRVYSQAHVNTDVPLIKLIFKKADHSEVRTQTKEILKGPSLSSNTFRVNDETIGDLTRYFTNEYTINIKLATPKQATNSSEIILLGISSPEEDSSRHAIASGIGANKKKSNKLFTAHCNNTKNTITGVEKFLQMELGDDEENKEIHGETENEGSSKNQPTKFSEVNNNFDNTKIKNKNLLTKTQKQQMNNLKAQEIAHENMKGKSEETEAKLGSNDILLNEKLHPYRETNFQKIKKKFFNHRPTKVNFQEYDTEPGSECRKENVADGNIESISKKNEYSDDNYDDDDEEELKKERSSTGSVTDELRKLKIYSYTVKSIYEEDASKTKFSFIDTFMENGVKYAVSSLIVSPDLGILNFILLVILWVILALCLCIKEQPSKTHRHVRLSQSEPQLQYTDHPFRKLMSSLSSFYRVVSFRTGPRGNVSRVPLSKLRKEHPSKKFSSGGTTWTCECSPSVDAPCSTSVRLAEEGRNFDSISSEFSDNSDLLRRLDEALNIIRAANTILSKPHSCPHLFPQQQTLSPPHTRSVPTFSACRSPYEQTRSSSPYQSWMFREAYWPNRPLSSASGHSEEFVRELPSEKRRYSLKSKTATEPLQSDSDWPSQELETELPSQKRYSSGIKAATQPLQCDSDWPSEELEKECPSQKRNIPSEDERCSLEPRVGPVCSQCDSDVSSCISIDIHRENAEENEKRPRKGSARRKKCKECGLVISSPSSVTDDTSRDAG